MRLIERTKRDRWRTLLRSYEAGECYPGLPWWIDGVDVTAWHRWGQRVGIVAGTVWRWLTWRWLT